MYYKTTTIWCDQNTKMICRNEYVSNGLFFPHTSRYLLHNGGSIIILLPLIESSGAKIRSWLSYCGGLKLAVTALHYWVANANDADAYIVCNCMIRHGDFPSWSAKIFATYIFPISS